MLRRRIPLTNLSRLATYTSRRERRENLFIPVCVSWEGRQAFSLSIFPYPESLSARTALVACISLFHNAILKQLAHQLVVMSHQ